MTAKPPLTLSGSDFVCVKVLRHFAGIAGISRAVRTFGVQREHFAGRAKNACRARVKRVLGPKRGQRAHRAGGPKCEPWVGSTRGPTTRGPTTREPSTRDGGTELDGLDTRLGDGRRRRRQVETDRFMAREKKGVGGNGGLVVRK